MEQYGDIAQFKIGHLRILLLNHPDFIKEVLSTQQDNFVKGRPLKMAKELLGEGLLTSEGDFHKHHSRIMQPAFHRK
ncbi:cytochrome P450 [Echinicola jeungdonensis]|uniref:cytochrome P450 n=1 Tax=Echinicola jeungdonensis TaxID=709343 RepID=UPI00338DFDD1